jgi:CHAT domain-containing protein
VTAIRKHKATLFVHFGAPAILYPPKKAGAAVFLTPESQDKQNAAPWNAAQIAGNDLSHVELVTLSTTAPGLMEYKYQGDMIGIVRPFVLAGAKRVVAPLWHIADEPAGEFMKAFYRSYAKNAPASVALHQAQLAFMRSEQWRHPHYWATYLLTEGL